MATDTDRLVLQLDADMTRLSKQLSRALGETDAFTKGMVSKHQSSIEKIERMYEQINLENKLQIATSGGDKERIRSLQEELELNRQIQRYRLAGMSTSDATNAGKAHMAALAAAAGGASSSLNRAQTMELTHVAKSLFDQMAAGASPMRALEVEGGRIAQVFSEGEGGVGGTFRAVTGLINPMTIGVGAAALALVTLAVVMGQVKRAGEEIEQLKITQEKLGIPVEQLQLWQFIAAQTHVSNEQLNQSFDGLSVTLGKLKSGIREQRIEPFIQELGITDADVAKANNAADLMDLIISKMDKIKDPSERVQIADAFGMQAALPLLSRTRVEIQGMTDDFSRNADVVTGKQADALDRQNAQLERAHALMHDKIRGDLADLAPLVGQLAVAWDGVAEAVLGAVADMARASSTKPAAVSTPAGIAKGSAHAVGQAIAGPAGGALADFASNAIAHLLQQGAPTGHAPVSIPHGAPTSSGGPNAAEITKAAKATEDLDKAMGEYVTHTSHAVEMQKRIAEDRKNGAKVSPQQEAQLMSAARAQDAKFGEGAAKKAQAAAEKALSETKASDDAISSAKKDELRARIALTADLLGDHQLKLAELAEDRDKKNRQAAQDAGMGKISASAASAVTGFNNDAYQAGVDLENRKFAETVADQARTYAADLARSQAAHLTAQAEIATTAEAWAADTRAAFALQQKADRDEFVDKTNKRMNELGANHLDASEAQAEIARFDASQADATSKSTRDTDLEVLSRKRAFADQLQGYVTSVLQAEAGMATTAAQRHAVEQRILTIRQQQEREALEDQIKKDHVAPQDASAARAGLAAQQAAQTAQSDYDDAGPLQVWAREAGKASGDVGAAFQTEAVKGVEGFNSALSESVVNAKSFGQAVQGVIRSIEGDLIQLILKQAEVGVFSGGAGLPNPFGGAANSSGVPGAHDIASSAFAAIDALTPPAFAGGTDDTPGGLTRYDEKGVEGYVPPGAQIIPNNVLKGLSKLTPERLSGSGGTTIVTQHYDLSGSVVTQDLMDQMNQISAQHAAVMGAHAISTSRSDLKRSQSSSRQSLTRY